MEDIRDQLIGDVTPFLEGLTREQREAPPFEEANESWTHSFLIWARSRREHDQIQKREVDQSDSKLLDPEVWDFFSWQKLNLEKTWRVLFHEKVYNRMTQMCEQDLLNLIHKINRFSQFGDIKRFKVLKEGPALFMAALSVWI